MRLDTDDTIAAIASGPAGAARGIVRVSGPQAISIVSKCFRGVDRLTELPRARSVEGTLLLHDLGPLPCQALVWPDSRSYTRQPSVELHMLGSQPLLESALEALCAAGARLAEAGEFTLRAFLAGRLDLTQAEAVLGVIQATSPAQFDVSLRQLAGGLAGPLGELRDQLLDLLAHLEAGLDFVEEDIEFISSDELIAQLSQGAACLESIHRQMQQRHDHHVDFRVVLRGEPNVGKSSLLNALAGDSAAIVSDIAGTTRDYVSRRLQLDGADCLLIDTAGLEDCRPEVDSVHSSAQRMTAEQGDAAQLEIFCVDGSRPITDREAAELRHPNSRRLVVLTKADIENLAGNSASVEHVVSSQTGRGIEELRHIIVERLAQTDAGVAAGTAARCADSVRLASESMGRAIAAAEHSLGEELVAAELRVVLSELGRIVGAVYTDDILDRVFSRFCIGK